ncbi:HAD family hydrolase [Streptomyces anulatus]
MMNRIEPLGMQLLRAGDGGVHGDDDALADNTSAGGVAGQACLKRGVEQHGDDPATVGAGPLLAQLPGGGALPHEEIIQRSRAHLLGTLHTMTAIPCVIELLEQARRAELPCAVASGATRQLVGPGLNTLGLAGEFDTVVARENVTRGKPDPKLYLIAARRLGVEPEHCLAVDDAPDGIATARAAGMHVITVLAGHLAPTGPEAAASGSARGQALPAASSGPLPRPAPRQKLRPPPSGRRRPDPGRHRP